MSNPDMNPGIEQPQQETKMELFRNIIPIIRERVGRRDKENQLEDLRRTEKRAIGFVVNKRAEDYSTDPNAFLSHKMDILDTDSSRDVAIKVKRAVTATTVEEIGERMTKEGISPQEQETLVQIRGMVEDSLLQSETNYKDPHARISLGGVPDEFVPDWVKKNS